MSFDVMRRSSEKVDVAKRLEGERALEKNEALASHVSRLLAKPSASAVPAECKEKVRATMEQYGERRGNVMRHAATRAMTLASPVGMLAAGQPHHMNTYVSGGIDFIPVVGGAKMTLEGLRGETWSGRKLSGKERVIQTAVGAGSVALDFVSFGAAGEVAKGAGKGALLAGHALPALERTSVRLATRAPKASRIAGKLAAFGRKHPRLAEACGDRLVSTIENAKRLQSAKNHPRHA